jgi:hypothetical protein
MGLSNSNIPREPRQFSSLTLEEADTARAAIRAQLAALQAGRQQFAALLIQLDQTIAKMTDFLNQ